MPSSKWLLALLLVSAQGWAFDMERDDWLLPPALAAAGSRPRYDPLVFARIKATGNDHEPVYARGRQRELIAAAARNDRAAVDALLKLGVNPNARADEWGDNALMHAVANGNVEMSRALLDAGANPDLPARGFTPLGMAALQGEDRIVRLLLDAGADIDRKSGDGNTPIIAATLMHHTAVVRGLLAYHPDISIWNREGRVSLGIAVEQGYADIVALMLAAAVDPNVMERNGNRPMFWAGGHHDIALMLLGRGGSSY
jgi:ankyrin repeat protein